MKTSQMLTDALNLLNEKGWCQGARVNDLGQRCISGALEEALWTELSGYTLDDYANATTYLKQAADSEHQLISTWNDEGGRSFEDVQLAFKKAIHAAKEDGD
jgi:hypothetical protein